MRGLAHAKADVADDFTAEALLQLAQDVDLGNLLELVMQCRLEHADVEDSFAQSDRCGVNRDKVTNDLAPCIDNLRLVQALF